MIHAVQLPSGNVARLRAPSLASVVEARGSAALLACLLWAAEDIEMYLEDVDEWLSDDDLVFVSQWAVTHLEQDTVDSLALIARTYSLAPSRYLELTDPLAGFALDALVAERITELESEAAEAADDEVSATRVSGRMDDPDDD